MKSSPSLAPPGAGIPTIERMVGGLQLKWLCFSCDVKATLAIIADERDRITQLTQGTPTTAAAQRVLIPRLPGLEDSSRDWSEWMTLDHLCIVNTQIAGVISLLIQGQTPPGPGASTAAVKPRTAVDEAVLEQFHLSCDQLLASARELLSGENPHLQARYRHPWFGALDARQWLVMAAMHLGIHRRQIVGIQHRR